MPSPPGAPAPARAARRRSVAGAAIALAAALCLLAFASQATAAAPSWPAPGLENAYAKHVGVSRADAEKQLALQDRARPLNAKLKKALGDAYAGLVFDDAGSGSFRVLVAASGSARGSDVDAARTTVRDTGLSSTEASVRLVEHGLSALESAERQVFASLQPQIGRNVASVTLDVRANAVTVQVDPAATDDDRTAARRAVTGLESIATVEDQPVERADPAACGTMNTDALASHAYCSAPLRGGVKIVDATSGSQCSIGGFATDVAQTHHYAITAAHCMNGNLGNTWYSRDWPAETRYDVGPASYSHFDGWGDFGFIDITNSPWAWFTPHPMNLPEQSIWGYDENWRILSTGITQSMPYVGEMVCWTGASSTGCGNVLALDQSVSYDGHTTVLTKTDVISGVGTGCLNPGTSGGAVADGHTIVGIADARTACTYAWFTPISKVAFAGGVNIAYG